jgi:hypothetical protein
VEGTEDPPEAVRVESGVRMLVTRSS